MLSELAWRAIADSLGLSQRQIEILRGVFDGRKETVIADDLGISSHTVHTHMERIFHKLGINGRLELVQFIIAEFLRLTADLTSGVPPICGYWSAHKCPMYSFGSDRRDGVSPGS
jgi:DNA-binding CsgD family transcriptional regulator